MSKCATKACICALLTLWIFTACCCFIATSVVYLGPFLKVVKYKRTTCVVESSFYSTQYVCPCTSGPTGSKQHCPSYPCLLVHVSVQLRRHVAVVPLFVDDRQQAAVYDANTDEPEMCTLHECSGNSLWNRERVDNFSRHLYTESDGHRQPVACLYDPWDVKSGAVLAASVHGWPVFHAIFWPFFSAAVGVLVCVGFCHRCHRVTTTSGPPPATTSDDVTSYAVAARALLRAQKRRKHRSIRNLWMMQQNM